MKLGCSQEWLRTCTRSTPWSLWNPKQLTIQRQAAAMARNTHGLLHWRKTSEKEGFFLDPSFSSLDQPRAVSAPSTDVPILTGIQWEVLGGSRTCSNSLPDQRKFNALQASDILIKMSYFIWLLSHNVFSILDLSGDNLTENLFYMFDGCKMNACRGRIQSHWQNSRTLHV